MEHLIIRGGQNYLPLARKFVKQLRRIGLPYASRAYLIGGVLVKVRIAPGHEYIDIGGEPSVFGWSAIPLSGPTMDDEVGSAPLGYVLEPPSPDDEPGVVKKQIPLTQEMFEGAESAQDYKALSNKIYIKPSLAIKEESVLTTGSALWSDGKKDRLLLGRGYVSYKQRRMDFGGFAILGGGVAKAEAGRWILVAVQGDDFATTFYAFDQAEVLKVKPGNRVQLDPVVIGSAPASSVAMTWRFSPDGLKAVALESKTIEASMRDTDGVLVESEFLEYADDLGLSLTGVQYIHRVAFTEVNGIEPGDPPFTVAHKKETREDAVIKVVPTKTFTMGQALREYQTWPAFAYKADVDFTFIRQDSSPPPFTAAGYGAEDYPDLASIFAIFPTGELTNAIANPTHPDYNNPNYYFIDEEGNRRLTRYFDIGPGEVGNDGGTRSLIELPPVTTGGPIRWSTVVTSTWAVGPVEAIEYSGQVSESDAVLAAQDFSSIADAVDAIESEASSIERDGESGQLVEPGSMPGVDRLIGDMLVQYSMSAESFGASSTDMTRCDFSITYKHPYFDKRTLDWGTKTTLHYAGARILAVGYTPSGDEVTLEIKGRPDDKVEYLSTQKSYDSDPAKTEGFVFTGMNHEYVMSGACGYDLVLGDKVLKSHIVRANASREAPTSWPNMMTGAATESTDIEVESFVVEDFDVFNGVVLTQEFSRRYVQSFGPDAEDGVATDDGEVTMVYASGGATELHRTEPRTAALESYGRDLEDSVLCRVLTMTDATGANEPLLAKELPPVSGVQFLQADSFEESGAKFQSLTGSSYEGIPSAPVEYFEGASYLAHGMWRVREAVVYRDLPQIDGVNFPVVRNDLGYDPPITRRLLALSPSKWLVHTSQFMTPDRVVFHDGSSLTEKLDYLDAAGAKFDKVSFIA